MNSMNTKQSRQPRTPAWVNMTIIGLIVVAGAWAVWHFGFKSPSTIARPRTETLATPSKLRGRPEARQVMANQPRREQRNNDELRVSKAGDVRGRRGELVVSVTKDKNGWGRIYLDAAGRHRWVSDPETALHLLAYRLANTPKMAQAVKLTPDQKVRLEALPYNIALSPAEETNLKAVLTAWVAKPDDDAGKAKVYAVLDEVAKAHLPKLEAAYKARVKAIPTILTAEQIAAAKDWANPKAAATPSTRPASNVATAAE